MAAAKAYEGRFADKIEDVSDPALAMGCDLVSTRPDGEVRYIEVKGRKRRGHVELKHNEWLQAQNHGPAYWLYVVYDCDTSPLLWVVQDPVAKNIGRPRPEVVVDPDEIEAHGTLVE